MIIRMVSLLWRKWLATACCQLPATPEYQTSSFIVVVSQSTLLLVASRHSWWASYSVSPVCSSTPHCILCPALFYSTYRYFLIPATVITFCFLYCTLFPRSLPDLKSEVKRTTVTQFRDIRTPVVFTRTYFNCIYSFRLPQSTYFWNTSFDVSFYLLLAISKNGPTYWYLHVSAAV